MINKVDNIMVVIDYIENNLTKKLNLTSIASAVGYSKYHLHRMFSDTVGLSIHNYVQRRQLTEAAKLLVFSNQSILEIALMAGYESQQAFTVAFKQMYKKSPHSYRIRGEFYPLQLRFVLKNELHQISSFNKINITVAKEEDIPLWLDLVHLIIDGYPNLKEDDYLEILKQTILEKRALMIKDRQIAIAVIAIRFDTGHIDFFGVHPLYRKYNLAKWFLQKVIDELLEDTKISVTTFRAGDKADTGYRKLYKELGFIEDKLLVEFGYPTQQFIFVPQTRKDMHETIRKKL